jgi:fumarate hydratase subunit beta
LNDLNEPASAGRAPIRLQLPIDEAQARQLRVGDTVIIDGEIVVSAGLPTYQRIADHLQRGEPLPMDLREGCLLHIGSYTRDAQDGSVEVLYMNPTTSTRFNPLMPGIIRSLGLHVVGGKGGLDAACAEAMREVGCVYLSIPGGACALLSQALRSVKDVAWREMLTHYRLVRLQVEGLGPATVAIDSHGNSLYDGLKVQAAHRLDSILAEMDAARRNEVLP